MKSKLTTEEKRARVLVLRRIHERQEPPRLDLLARLRASPLITSAEASMLDAAIYCGYAALERRFATCRADREGALQLLDEAGTGFLHDARQAGFDVGY